MSTTKTAPTNGAHKQLSTSTNVTDKNPNQSKVISTDFTAQIKKEEKAIDEQKPIEDIVLKIQMLSDLVERRNKLLESKQKLNSFKLSTDGLRDKLGINDGKGNEFLTSNTAVIKDVIETLKTSIQQKLDDIEKQILF